MTGNPSGPMKLAESRSTRSHAHGRRHDDRGGNALVAQERHGIGALPKQIDHATDQRTPQEWDRATGAPGSLRCHERRGCRQRHAEILGVGGAGTARDDHEVVGTSSSSGQPHSMELVSGQLRGRLRAFLAAVDGSWWLRPDKPSWLRGARGLGALMIQSGSTSGTVGGGASDLLGGRVPVTSVVERGRWRG
jgi:hypothetical protein